MRHRAAIVAACLVLFANGAQAETPPLKQVAARVELLTDALGRERALNDELRSDLNEVRAELRASQERVVGLLAPPRRRWWPWR